MEKIMSFDEFLARSGNSSSATLLFKDAVWFIVRIVFFVSIMSVIITNLGINGFFWYLVIASVTISIVLFFSDSDYLKGKKDYMAYKEEKKDEDDEIHAIRKDVQILRLIKYLNNSNSFFRKAAKQRLLYLYHNDDIKYSDKRKIVHIFIGKYKSEEFDFDFLITHFSDSEEVFEIFLEKEIYLLNKCCGESNVTGFNLYLFKKFNLNKEFVRKKIYDFFDKTIILTDKRNSCIAKFLKEDIFICDESLRYFEYFLALQNRDLTFLVIDSLSAYSENNKAFTILESEYNKSDNLIRKEIIKSLAFFDKKKFFKFLYSRLDGIKQLSTPILENLNLILNLHNEEVYKSEEFDLVVNKIVLLAKHDDGILNYILSKKYGYNYKNIEFLIEFQNSNKLAIRIQVAEKAMYCVENKYGVLSPILILEEMAQKEGENPILVKKISNFLKKNKTEEK